MEVETSSRYFSLVVGVNGQPVPGRAELKYAENDAQDMTETLREDFCGFELFRSPLLGKQATSAHLKYAVIKLAQALQVGDSVLFFFSGHAEALPINAEMDEVYLVTDDFERDDIEIDKDAHVSLRWLRQVLFEHKKASSVLIILDCCYAGKFADRAPDPYLDALYQRLRYYFGEPGASSPSLQGGIRLALTATGARTAKEQDGHGLLTGHILTALRGECEQAANEQGQVTFTSLFSYLDHVMPSDQRPHFFGAGSRMILAKHPDLFAEKRHEREQAVRRAERKQRLRTTFADHRGFLQDRLESFVGRERELAEVRQRIEALLSTGGYLTITGQAGQGKSSIIAKLIEDTAKEQNSLEHVAYHFIPLTPPPDYQVALLRNLMARLILKYELSDLFLASESRAALGEGFPRVLKEIADKGETEIIFIDGLDQLQADQQTGQRDLSFLPQGPGNPPQGIVFVLGTRPNDTLRPLELLKPYHEYKLPNLSRADFDHILQRRGVTLEQTLADRFYETLDENALYLDLVAKELAAWHDITNQKVEEIVQQIADDPENLFSLTVDRLRRQETLWTAVIKPVLGLLLVTNEPLVRQHLKHLLNLDSTQKVDGEQLNRGLERLGGLIVIDDQQRYSLFHLKFREYLRQDTQRPNKKYVFDREDEQHWDRCFIAWCEQDGIAQIWDNTASDVIEQGRRCYARLHYITHLYRAGDWNKLFGILDESIYGKAKVEYDPSKRTYALDLDLGRLAASSAYWNRQKNFQHLQRLWQYTLLRCTLATWADSFPAVTFQLMLLLKQETKALGLAELLTRPDHKAQVFLLIATHLMMQPEREREAALLFLRTEQVIYSISDKKSKVQALTELGRALTQVQYWQEAERVIHALPYEWHKVEGLIELEKALIHAQQWQEAERVIHLLPIDEHKAHALVELGRVLAQAQRWQDAERMWQKAEWVIDFFSAEGSKEAGLTHLGVALAQAQQWQEAKRVIHSISDEESKDRVLTHLAMALTHAQRWQEAERVIYSLSNEESEVKTMIGLRRALAQAQQWQEAKRIIRSIPDKWRKIEALTELGKALAQAQHWQEAERIWQESEQVIHTLSNEKSKVEALTELGRVLVQARHRKEAARIRQDAERIRQKVEQTVDFSPSGKYKASALIKRGKSLVQAQRPQDAKRILNEAEQVISSFYNVKDEASALIELGKTLVRVQQRQDAERIWQKAERVINSFYSSHYLNEIEKDSASAEALTELAKALIQAQGWQKAEQVINSIRIERSKFKALAELGIALAQAQRWQEAERVIRSLPNQKSKAEALTELWRALVRAQHWQEAERIINFSFNKQLKGDTLSNVPIKLSKQDQAVSLIQRQWLGVSNRDEALALFPLVCGLIPLNPYIGVELFNTFEWVESFLRG